MYKNVLFVFLFVTTTAVAQEAPYAQKKRALLFDVNSWELDAFSGGFGGKYFVSPQKAWSLGVKMDFLASSRSYGSGGEEASTRMSTAISPGYDYYFTGRGRFSPFVGARMTLSYQRDSREISTGGNSDSAPNTESGFYASFGPLLGAEYFLTSNISLAGYYIFVLGYGNFSNDQGIGDHSFFSLGTRFSGLQLSIYF